MRQAWRARPAVTSKKVKAGKPGDAGRKRYAVRHSVACRAEGVT